MRVLLNSDISIISVHLKEVSQSENTGGLSSSLVQDTISTLSEVQAWGAGGRGFKSHWPHSDISSLIGFTRKKGETRPMEIEQEQQPIGDSNAYSFVYVCSEIASYKGLLSETVADFL